MAEEFEKPQYSEQEQIRRAKLAKYCEEGRDPYTITRFDRTHTSAEVLSNFDALEGKTVRIAGRMMSRRIMGKASFVHMMDGEGQIQAYVRREDVGEDVYADFKTMDIGDILGVEGVVFRTGMDVGGAVPAEQLLADFDAVVLCCGAKKPRDLNVPGRDANGVHFAVDYLTSVTRSLLDSKFADGRAIDAKGKNVLVIGGGDTGNDCQGTALRQGCTDLVALEMMPQPPKERAATNPWPEWPRVLKVDYGQTECMAKFGKDPRVYQTTVKEFLKDDAGNLTAAVISYLKPERDPETGRTNMVPTGEEFTYNCELAFIAAGFVGCESYVADAFGVSLTGRGCVDTDHFRTNVDKVFACGDMRRGQSLVVWGLREGRDCAAEVDRYLMGYTNL